MLNDDIEVVNKLMEDGGTWSHHREAWHRIKSFCEDAQKEYLTQIADLTRYAVQYYMDSFGKYKLTMDKHEKGPFLKFEEVINISIKKENKDASILEV